MALDFHRIYILLDTGLLHFGLSNLLDFKAAWNVDALEKLKSFKLQSEEPMAMA